MKKSIIALALASIAASASAFYDGNGNWIAEGGGYTFDVLGGVTVIGKPLPPGNLCAPFACMFPLPSIGSDGGSSGGTGSSAPPPPPPPTPTPIKPPPPDKATCLNNCATDRKVRDNSCASESRSLQNRRENQALAAERLRLPTVILKMMLLGGEIPDIPAQVQIEIEREVKSFDKFCGAIAAEAENACISNCASLAWFLPMLFWRRRREEDRPA